MSQAKLRGLLCLFCSLLIPALVLGQDLAGDRDQQPQNVQRARPAGEQAGDWLIPVTKPGAPVRVVERSGRSTLGTLVGVLPSAIRVRSDGITREVALTEIAIVRRNGDPLWNGIAWGGGIAGVMFLGYNGDCDTCYSAAELTLFRSAMAGVGAGLGALLDLLVRDKRILYRAPMTPTLSGRLEMHPVVDGRARGLLLSVRW